MTNILCAIVLCTNLNSANQIINEMVVSNFIETITVTTNVTVTTDEVKAPDNPGFVYTGANLTLNEGILLRDLTDCVATQANYIFPNQPHPATTKTETTEIHKIYELTFMWRGEFMAGKKDILLSTSNRIWKIKSEWVEEPNK